MKPQAFAVGNYRVRLGEDGRIRLPVEWRRLFATSKAPVFMLVPKGCNYVKMVPGDRARKITRVLRARAEPHIPADPQGQEMIKDVREMMEGAMYITIRSEGRLTIPRALRERVGLSGKVVLAGCFDAAQIWSYASWKNEGARMQSAASHVVDYFMKGI